MSPSELPIAGFQTAGLHCGLKPDGASDLALVASDSPCRAAGVFTTNRVQGAPIVYNRRILSDEEPIIRAVVVNAGNANACTGPGGLDDVAEMAAATADAVGCVPDEVLVLSTGVIGERLPMDLLRSGIRRLVDALAPGTWNDAATAMMTTDTRPKVALRQGGADGDSYGLAGIAKGSGMIAPNMATMLGVLVTDAVLTTAELKQMLKAASHESFHRIVVDGDMSPSDAVVLLANGASGVRPDLAEFTVLLTDACRELARAIVADGEGATRFVTLRITGAEDEHDARTVARAIAVSPLCKTAFHGADANWGRFVCAAGATGVPFDPARLELSLVRLDGAELPLLTGGEPADYNEAAATAWMSDSEWGLRLDLGQGTAEDEVWTCDLSHDYVTINASYRS